jgi:hypothetical protein
MGALFVVALGCLLAACGTSPGSDTGTAPAEPSPQTKASPQEPFRLVNVFPAGAGRDQVLNSCGSCHSAVCVTRGQRSKERWESVKDSHKDKLPNTSATELNEMFSYLAANFNESKPEPEVPAELLAQGCTPF